MTTSFYLTHISVESRTEPPTWLYLFLPHTYFSIIIGGYSNKQNIEELSSVACGVYVLKEAK
jgi:hypothetical protein